MGDASMITEESLRAYLSSGKNGQEIAEIEGCCSRTIRNYMKRYGFPTPSGFLSRGLPIGRPKGIPMSEEQKKYFSNLFKGDGNPFYGKKHSRKTRKKMSKNHADFTGDNNPFKRALERDPSKREELRERRRKFWASRDEEWMKKFSKKLSKSMAETHRLRGNVFHKFHDSGFVNTKKAGRVFCRSSWEKNVCKYLDENNSVMAYELEPFCIKYLNQNEEERYSRIDFFVESKDGIKLMIEVKPSGLIEHDKYKIHGYKVYCQENGIRFMLATEKVVLDGGCFDAFLKDGLK